MFIFLLLTKWIQVVKYEDAFFFSFFICIFKLTSDFVYFLTVVLTYLACTSFVPWVHVDGETITVFLNVDSVVMFFVQTQT